ECCINPLYYVLPKYIIIYNVSAVKSILLTYSMEIFLLKLRPKVDMILKRVVMLNEERNQYFFER
ncbi:hypothetical protein CW689_11745, partial [Macrococcoides caseolyticum]